eukprot:TRINITY_DN11383_c0_g1_i1.p1 TRINITY_DN11383_c0_g1~~TRINITY_DN11383_c0_g1_i1.p1  ORF type:complete len:291 (+),score=38.53 TRINITY_DN11383_c0_g1_i1:421-1293(+)
MILLQLSPCFERAKSDVAAGGSSDTLLKRMVLVPQHFGLANGFAVNQIGITVVSELRSVPAFQGAQAQFFIQVFYCILIWVITVTLTAAWHRRKKTKAEESVDDVFDRDHENRNSRDLEAVASQTVLSALSFVFAWAVSNTLSDLYFMFMIGCSGALSCSYQQNAAYSVMVTLTCFFLVTSVNSVETERSDWDKTQRELLVTACSLTVGWAWTNFFATLVASSGDDSKLLSYAFLLVFYWSAAVVGYHAFLHEIRVFRRLAAIRKEELQHRIEEEKQCDRALPASFKLTV